jgi:hypothetical protein
MIQSNKIDFEKLPVGEESALVIFLMLEYLVTSKDCYDTALTIANVLIKPEHVKNLNMV